MRLITPGKASLSESYLHDGWGEVQKAYREDIISLGGEVNGLKMLLQAKKVELQRSVRFYFVAWCK